MAIQFLCSACGQPVEVDDDMANLTVTCPYCRKVVTTPTQSTLTARPDAPAVGPLPPGAMPLPQPFAPVLTPPPKRSILGWLSLGCMAITVVTSIYFSVAWASLTAGIDLKKPEEAQKAVAERAQNLPRLQMVGLSGSCICSVILPLLGVVFAIIALVKRSQPRWPAIVSLCLFGAGIVLSCAGVLMRGGASPPGG
jgi:hypothetical protein